MAKNVKKQISKTGYDKLLQELNELKKVKLPEVLERLTEAKALGDLSENFEYKTALEDKDLVNSRIAELEELIENVEIVDENSGTRDTIEYGSTVQVELESWKQYTIEIVGSSEVAITDDVLKISIESPIGMAIRGKKAGDTVKMRLANEKQDVKILSVA